MKLLLLLISVVFAEPSQNNERQSTDLMHESTSPVRTNERAVALPDKALYLPVAEEFIPDMQSAADEMANLPVVTGQMTKYYEQNPGSGPYRL